MDRPEQPEKPLSDISRELSKAIHHHQSGQLAEAEQIYRAILDIQPDHPEATHMLGILAHQSGRHGVAVNLIVKAIQINPDDPHYYNNLGAALKEQGRLDEAMACYRKTLQLQPDYAEAFNNMGNALRQQRKLNEAIAAYQQAIRLKPDFLKAYTNMGIAFKDQGLPDEAIACYQRAVQIQPDHADAYDRMGNTFRDQGKMAQAVSAYEKALAIRPDPGIKVRKALMVPPINESKAQIEQIRKTLIENLERLKNENLRLHDPHQQMGTPNFYLAYHGLNDRDIQKKIADFYIHVCPDLCKDLTVKDRRLDSSNPKFQVSSFKLQIAFVSIHLYHSTQQTVGKLTQGIITHLSREKFHVTLFCFSGRNNQRAERLGADQIVLLPNKLREAREKIAEHSPDILFYPDIGMDSLTYFLAFSRLAPVQCVTWGHPVTTGIPNMDYFLTSEHLEPPDPTDHYSERPVLLKRLPVYYYRPDPLTEKRSRKRFNLPEEANLYVCPQALFKFHPDFDPALREILRHDPRGLLVFLEGSYPHFTTRIRERLNRAFPDMIHRVCFLPFMPHKDFLSLLMLADALIDPPYFGGGNTTYESFALGRPIVTWPGPFMRGRVTLGCYRQMGVMDCVANDANSYISLALRLANDRPWRDEVREKIRANADKLFEEMEAVKEIEHFFERAMGNGRWAMGERRAEGGERQGASGERIGTRGLSPLAPRPSPIAHSPSAPSPLALSPDFEKAIQCYESGHPQEAETICQAILETDPNHGDALHLSGVIAHQTGKKELSVNLIRRAIQADPGKACYHSSLGITFQDQGKTNEAVACYQKALQIRPDFVEAYSNMGFALLDQRRTDEAIACYQKALQIRPNDAVAYNDMGTALQEQAKVDEAVVCYQKALQIRPNYPEAYNNLGNAFKEQQKLDESIQCYKKALELNPDYTKAHSYLIRQLQQTCAWDEVERLMPRLDELTRNELESGLKTSESPFMNVTRTMDSSYNLAVAKSWADDAAKPMRHLNLSFSFDDRRPLSVASGSLMDGGQRTTTHKPQTTNHKLQRTDNEPIKIGYLSGDFRNHAVSHLMLGLFGLHDRRTFRVCCYSYGPDDGSEYRERIKRDADKFVDIRTLSHADAARRIHDDRVDILVELGGHTKDGRLGICALRPAPIQATYLGFAGTTGADFIDYILTDSIVTPEEHAPFYTEKFVYMPHCFQINDNTQPISEKNWTKADFGIPEETFLFCSFNHGYKIEPVMFGVWMRILQQVSKGVLWLPVKSETGKRNIREAARVRGVDPERLFFAERFPTKGEYLARIRLADLVLDTRIYNGHTTTSDALWAGVPVITLQGGHYASRVASSILTAVGLPELVTHGLNAYEGLAVRLANDPEELGGIRQKLEGNRLTAPLFDTAGFVRDLERAYRKMWENFLDGKGARQIAVSAAP